MDPKRLTEQASGQADDAWDRRYKHGKAARTWAALAVEEPEKAPLYRTLAAWMAAYEQADAEAEQAFRDLSSEYV